MSEKHLEEVIKKRIKCRNPLMQQNKLFHNFLVISTPCILPGRYSVMALEVISIGLF